MRSPWLACLALAGCGSVSNEKKDAAVAGDDMMVVVDTPMADTPTCAVTPAMQKARYRAETNANDHTGAFNGTAVGSNFTYVPGKYGQAFSLDGTEDLVTIDDTELLWPGTQSLSLEGWFKTTSVTASDGLVCKYACGDQCVTNMSNTYFCLFLNTNGNPAFDFRADSEATVSQVVANVTVTDGNWHHLVAVRDVTAQSATLYVDGAAAATITPGAAAFGAMTDNDSNLDLVVIGGAVVAGATTYDTFFNGQLDEIAVYHSALSAAQVQAIYSAPDGKCL